MEIGKKTLRRLQRFAKFLEDGNLTELDKMEAVECEDWAEDVRRRNLPIPKGKFLLDKWEKKRKA